MAPKEEQLEELLIKAINNSKIGRIQVILAYGIDPDKQIRNELLMKEIQKNPSKDSKRFKLLVEIGADLDAAEKAIAVREYQKSRGVLQNQQKQNNIVK